MLNKILIVQDYISRMNMNINTILNYSNMEYVFALNGQEGMERLAHAVDFKLIILDIDVLDAEGMAFLGTANGGGFGHIQTLVTYNEGTDKDISRALELGAISCFKKSAHGENLNKIISAIVGRGPEKVGNE